MTPLHQGKEGREITVIYINSIRITLVTHHAENTETNYTSRMTKTETRPSPQWPWRIKSHICPLLNLEGGWVKLAAAVKKCPAIAMSPWQRLNDWQTGDRQDVSVPFQEIPSCLMCNPLYETGQTAEVSARLCVCVSSMWENMRLQLHHLSQKCLKLFSIGLTSFIHPSIHQPQPKCPSATAVLTSYTALNY